MVCHAEGATKYTEAEAIEAWNTRATGGTLTAEQVRKAIFNGSSYASYDGAQYYANGIDMQAIADELNSRAERTCENVSKTNNFRCSECDATDFDFDKPSYCHGCGAKVVGE